MKDDAPYFDMPVTPISSRILSASRPSVYHRWLEHAPDLMAIVRADGSFEPLNPAWTRLLGYSHEVLRSQPLTAFVHPDDVALTRAALVALTNSEGPVRFTHRLRAHDGSHRRLDWLLERGPEGDAYGSAREVRDPAAALPSTDVVAQLHKMQERLAAVVAGAPVVLFAADGEGRLTLSEGAGLRAMGVASGELVGRLFYELYPDPREGLEHFERVMRGENVHAVVELPRVTYDVRLSPLRGPDGRVTGVLGVATDVTELRRAEKAVRENKRFLRSVIDTVPSSIFIFDRERCLLANQASVQFFGKTPEQIMGRSYQEIGMPADVATSIEQQLRAVIDENRSLLETEQRVVAPDGTTRWFQLRVVPIDLPHGERAMLGVAEDVTACKSAEAALRRSEARFRQLIEQAPDAIAVHRDGRFVYCNSQMVRLLGFERADEILGRAIDEFIHPDERAQVAARVHIVMETGQLAPPLEERLVRRDGAIVVAEISGLPIEYDGAPAMLAIARDVTERTLMQARLQQADRLVAVGTLAAGVAHEINNPLAYVLANVVWARDELDALRSSEWSGVPPELRARLEEIRAPLDEARAGAERVRDIVRGLKVFSRAEDDRREAVDVCAVLDSAVQMARNEIRHRARLVKHYDPVQPVVANASRLAQVFLNLLINAAQAIPDGANEIRLRVRDAPGAVVVSVSDTGEGIPRHLLDRIFDPFFTTKPVGVGTGLGLSICHGIVSALGGQITVESEVGRGTTFFVTLPAMPGHDEAVRCSEHPAPSLRRLRVLVVDDEPAIGTTLRRLIGRGHDVTVVHCGREALARLADGDYDAIFCDVSMPDVTGIEVFEWVRAQRPALAERFVFMTGGALSEQSQHFLDRVAPRKVPKPFHPKEIYAALRAAAGERAN